MPSTLEHVKAAVIRAAIKGGQKTPGSTVESALSHHVYKQLQFLTAESPRVPVTSIASFVRNTLITWLIETKNTTAEKAKTDKQLKKTGRIMGTAIVMSPAVSSCWLIEEKKQAFYVCSRKCKSGDKGTYKVRDGVIELTVTDTGSSQPCLDKCYAPADFIVKMDKKSQTLNVAIRDMRDSNTDELVEIISSRKTASNMLPVFGPVWYKTKLSYAYINADGFYVESRSPDGAPLNNIKERKVEVDCKEFFPIEDYPNGMPKVAKMVFYGRFTFVIMVEQIDSPEWTELSAAPTYQLYLSHQIYYLYIYSLLIIDTQELTVTHKSLADTTLWRELIKPAGFKVGYIDIQIDQLTGNLLLLKSCEEPVEQPFPVRMLRRPTAQEPPDAYVYVETRTPKVAGVAYTIEEVAIRLGSPASEDGTIPATPALPVELDFVSLRYTQLGILTAVKGLAMTAGITAMSFTQVPDTGDLYVRRHVTGYLQRDASNTSDWRRDDAIVAISSWQIFDVTEEEILHEVLSNYTSWMVPFIDYIGQSIHPPELTTDMYMYMYIDWALTTPLIVDCYPELDDGAKEGFILYYKFHDNFGSSNIDWTESEAGYDVEDLNMVKDSAHYDGVYNRPGAFLALRDSVTLGIKFIVACSITFVSKTEGVWSFQTQQGWFFFKELDKIIPAGILDAIGMDKVHISKGFIPPPDITPPQPPDTVNMMQGYIDGSMVQVSANRVVFVVSRFERRIAFQLDSYGQVDFYVAAMQTYVEHISYAGTVEAKEDMMYGGHFLDSPQEKFFLTQLFDLKRMESDALLVKVACPHAMPYNDGF